MLTSILYNIQHMNIDDITSKCDLHKSYTETDMANGCYNSKSIGNARNHFGSATVALNSSKNRFNDQSKLNCEQHSLHDCHNRFPVAFESEKHIRNKMQDDDYVVEKMNKHSFLNFQFSELDKFSYLNINDWSNQDSETDSGFDTSDEGSNEAILNSKLSSYEVDHMTKINMAAAYNCSNIHDSPSCSATPEEYPGNDYSFATVQMIMLTDCDDDDDEEVSRIFDNATPDQLSELDVMCSGFDPDYFRPYSPLNFDFNENYTSYTNNSSSSSYRPDLISPVQFDLRPPDHVIRPALLR